MMDTLRTGSRGWTEDVVFKNGTSMEALIEPLPEGPDDCIWPIKLDTWSWTKFVTCSKLWNKACTGFSDMLPEIRFEDKIWGKVTNKSIHQSQQSSSNNWIHRNNIQIKAMNYIYVVNLNPK